MCSTPLSLISKPNAACHALAAATTLCSLDPANCRVDGLQNALAREKILLREREDMVERHELFNREAEHRLMNGIQLVVSLLALQSRASSNPIVTSELSQAADRVATLLRVHRRLRSPSGNQVVAFADYLADLCHDVSRIVTSRETGDKVVLVERVDVDLDHATATNLSFVANELVTNALKYGEGVVEIRLFRMNAGNYLLSVSNEGEPLPTGFDPRNSKGLGMAIVRSLTAKMGASLVYGRNSNGRGACFTVEFSNRLSTIIPSASH